MMVKLIAADMDGTLLDSNKQLSPRLFPLLKTLHQKGVRFAVASGRQYYTLLEQFQEIQDQITFISENGAMVMEKGVSLYLDRIDPQSVARHVEMIRNISGAYPVLCGAKSAYYENSDPIFLDNFEMYYARTQKLDDVLDALHEDTIFKIAVFDEKGAEGNTYVKLQQSGEGLEVILSGLYWVDLMNPGVNKGKALTTLQKAYGISPEETMAFGDYLNDVEMMEACFHSYAMANAHPKLKELCRFEAASNDEDGVVQAITDYFKL